MNKDVLKKVYEFLQKTFNILQKTFYTFTKHSKLVL